MFSLITRNMRVESKPFIRALTSTANDSDDVIKLTLYTKPDCTLCDKAKEELEEAYGGKFQLEEVNILKSRDLFRKFKLDIPVFYYNNQFLMQHKIDRQKLDELIQSLKK